MAEILDILLELLDTVPIMMPLLAFTVAVSTLSMVFRMLTQETHPTPLYHSTTIDNDIWNKEEEEVIKESENHQCPYCRSTMLNDNCSHCGYHK